MKAANGTSAQHLATPRLIVRKRDGGELGREEVARLLLGYLAGDVPDYQMSALLMAITLRGMSAAELDEWTAVLISSGERWDWSYVPGAKVDKHSTGGVGDKVSLVLAPLLASLGLKVPMVSGRGLGHTAGTLDKIESIPGIRTDLTREDFERLLNEVGFAMGGQTSSLVPLDRELYALRDVTGTIESIPLIAASIVSKKVAEGAEHLVLDVKIGAGAFLPDRRMGEELARLMIELAARHGVRAEALLTGMDQPLGRTAGNALEVREAIQALRGEGPADLIDVTLALATRLLVMSGIERDESAARTRAARALADGSALESFRRWVSAQGGDPQVVDDPELLPQAPVQLDVPAHRGGYVHSLDARRVGDLVVGLGGGRTRKDDMVDPAVGVTFERKVGDAVERGERLATIHASDASAAEGAARQLARIYEIGDERVEPEPIVRGHITAGAELLRTAGWTPADLLNRRD